MMEDPNANKRTAARDDTCGDTVPSRSLQQPPVRPLEKCAPGEERLPEVFIVPSDPAPAAPPPDQFPAPLVVFSEELTVVCADVPDVGPTGAAVTVPYGQYTLAFYFQTVPGILARQLTYIYGLSADERAMLLSPSVTVSTVRAITKLDLSQSSYIKTQLNANRIAVALQARDFALVTLDCYWENTPQTAQCPEGALVEPAPVSVVNPFTTAAGTFQSRVSQEDANTQAMLFAQSSLLCQYGNDEITRSCLDIGFPDPVPNDDNVIGNAGAPRVGTITVAANTFFSTESKEEANGQAINAALTSLVCFYLNQPVTRTCTDLGFGGGTVVNPVTADLGTPGNPVTVPLGFIVSSVSQVDADTRARSLADGLLNCFWVNVEVTETCQPQTVTNPDGTTRQVAASDRSPVRTVTISAGEVSSTVSQEDADTQARLLARLQLECLYCNALIMPVCVPPSAIDRDPLVVPIPIEWVSSDWSIDATLGVAAGTFCADNAEAADNVATSVGSIPVDTLANGQDCRYANDEVKAGCIATADNIGPFTPSSGTGLSERSSPNPFAANSEERYLTVSAGTIVIGEKEVPDDFLPGDPFRAKQYANQLARQLALSFLNCFFESDAKTFTCAGDLGLPGVAPTSTDNVTIPAGVFQSLASKAEANASRDALGLSSLYCYYTNIQQQFYCEFKDEVSPRSKGAVSNPVVVPANTFTSFVSQLEVDTQVAIMAASLLNCFWSNVQLSVKCANFGDQAKGYTLSGTGTTIEVVVTADRFESIISQEDADQQARAFGLAQTYCFFSNKAISVSCKSGKFAKGAISSASVSAGSVTSATSAAEANTLAELVATSALNCVYTNTKQNSDACPGDQRPTVPNVSVPEGTTTGSTQEEANQAAKNLANSMQGCTNDPPPGDGLPGNDGAQRNCAGQCFGVYS